MDNSKMVYVKMTKTQFLRGRRCSKFRCAFALALNRHLKYDFVAGVTKNVIYFQKTGECPDAKFLAENTVASTNTPGKVRDFIRKYDNKNPGEKFVLPLRTRVRIPREILA